MPYRFMLILPLSLALIAYQVYISFEWKYSIIRFDGVVPVIYLWGYGPPLLIVFIQVLYGWASPNEDKELLRQRRERGETLDRELGIVRKPAWWRRVKGEHLLSYRDKIARNVAEVGGQRGTGRRDLTEAERHAREEALANARNEDVELQPVRRSEPENPRVDRAGVRTQKHLATSYGGKSDTRRHERTMQVAAGILFPNSALEERARREAELAQDGPPPPPYADETHREQGRGRSPTDRTGSAGRSNSAETTNSITAPPQQVRSMLDV